VEKVLKVGGTWLMTLVVACSSPSAGPTAGPTPNVEATVQVAVQATLQARERAAPTAAATSTPGLSSSVDPTPEPPDEPAAEPERLVVVDAGPAGVLLRATPGSGDRLKVLQDGAELSSLGEEQQAEGRSWQRVKDADGTEGWVASEFLGTGSASIEPAP